MANAARGAAGIAGAELSERATAWAVASALGVLYVLSTYPTPLYVGYRQAFGFSPLLLTLIYAAYVVGTLAAMMFFGRLSDQIGRRPVLLAALGCGGAAVVLFLLARSTPWLFAARIASGFAVALASGACTAWIVEAHPAGKRRATQLAIGANLAGLGVGPLLAGALGERARAPLHTPYVALLPLLLGAFAAIWLCHETVASTKPAKQVSLRPGLGVPAGIRSQFVVAAVAAFATFAVLGFYAALVPTVLRNELHQSSRAVAGAVTGGMFVVAALAVAVVEMDPAHGLIVGLALLVPGVAGLVVAEHARSMTLVLASSAVIGVASGFGYRFGVELVNEIAPADHRAEVVSAYLVVCYAAISLPVIGLGVASTMTSARIADTVFGAAVAALAVAALVVELVLRARR